MPSNASRIKTQCIIWNYRRPPALGPHNRFLIIFHQSVEAFYQQSDAIFFFRFLFFHLNQTVIFFSLHPRVLCVRYILFVKKQIFDSLNDHLLSSTMPNKTINNRTEKKTLFLLMSESMAGRTRARVLAILFCQKQTKPSKPKM